jgi:hypothetical protein
VERGDMTNRDTKPVDHRLAAADTIDANHMGVLGLDGLRQRFTPQDRIPTAYVPAPVQQVVSGQARKRRSRERLPAARRSATATLREYAKGP